jgi:hypothetical protein
MPIAFACKSCGAKIRAPDETEGCVFSCPNCKASVTVPGDSTSSPKATNTPRQSLLRPRYRVRTAANRFYVLQGNAGIAVNF